MKVVSEEVQPWGIVNQIFFSFISASNLGFSESYQEEHR